MTITRLDHVNLRTTRLAEMIQWYEEILGLSAGVRPEFNMDGAWLYAGDVAAVHLVAVEDDGAAGSETALKLEHFAFRADGDADVFQDRLQKRGVSYRRSGIEAMDLVAFNIWDPDGNHIHVDFIDD
ncbi:VOC family protein [Tateyamaria omphalii]|uniref:VOC family protein n=1 Tax=Tateyamaria omphalii TaxID=299262 RepID=UPI001C9A1437|nr:VOC family protein [Tateyamaria omphalii]MBY5932525.1 VOC family protein [Tateyamaria omphalii]